MPLGPATITPSISRWPLEDTTPASSLTTRDAPASETDMLQDVGP